MIPLAYVVQDDEVTARTLSPLEPNSPHSVEHGSIEEEIIEFASHSHALFCNDSASVYYHLEKATHSTHCTLSTKPN